MKQHSNFDLSKYRIDKAKQTLKAAEELLNTNKYLDSINRSYYAIFHITRALFAIDEFDTRKHSGVISYFNKNYVKTGLIEKDYSVIIMSAEKLRGRSDYDDFYIASREDAEKQCQNAKKFLKKLEDYISKLEKE